MGKNKKSQNGGFKRMKFQTISIFAILLLLSLSINTYALSSNILQAYQNTSNINESIFRINYNSSNNMNVSFYAKNNNNNASKVVDYVNPGICYNPLNDTIMVIDWDNSYLMEYDKTSLEPTGYNFSLSSLPQNCDFREQSNEFIVGYNANGVERIVAYDSEGVLVETIKNLATDVNGLSIYSNGDIGYCYDTTLYRINRSGDNLGSITLGCSCDGLAINKVQGVDYSYWVSCSAAEELREFDLSGVYTGNYIIPSDTGVEGLDMENNVIYHANDNHGGAQNIFYAYYRNNYIGSLNNIATGIHNFVWENKVTDFVWDYYITSNSDSYNRTNIIFPYNINFRSYKINIQHYVKNNTKQTSIYDLTTAKYSYANNGIIDFNNLIWGDI